VNGLRNRLETQGFVDEYISIMSHLEQGTSGLRVSVYVSQSFLRVMAAEHGTTGLGRRRLCASNLSLLLNRVGLLARSSRHDTSVLLNVLCERGLKWQWLGTGIESILWRCRTALRMKGTSAR
jgi:hypothetical protein